MDALPIFFYSENSLNSIHQRQCLDAAPIYSPLFMAIKKSELYGSLWRSCDELRGSMDASQYKDYVLVLLFVKYVSDKYASQKDAMLSVPEDGSFEALVRLKGDKEIGDKTNKTIGRLLAANGLEGKIKVADFNDENLLGKGQDMVDRLGGLIGTFAGLDFRRNRAGGDDLLGDAYEFLMRHFATESGKSKGQFYTPAEVSRIMARVIGIGAATNSDQTIYDPTCGSGSLLLKAHDEALSDAGLDLSIYGQEMDNTTAALAKMNMILHDCITAEIWQDNTLANPYFKDEAGSLKRFDFAVANPPFSTKAWSSGLTPFSDEWKRFEMGVPPAKNGDYAFLLHLLTSLKSSGKGAVILPHGVLFRGGAEADIRRNLVRQGVIKGIIGLPANLFYGTGIPACILVLDKENAGARRGIFMIDASKGFIKDGNKNRLRAQDIHKIVDAFSRTLDAPRYSRMISAREIEKHDYNLNIPRYIDASAPEDEQSIEAHLRGGIPNSDIDALGAYWKELPAVRALLFEDERAGFSRLRVGADEVKNAIFGHPQFTQFHLTGTQLFERWKADNEPKLRAISMGTQPKSLVEELSEHLLELFAGAPLLDPYDVYQHLLDYWDATMQDDVYLIVSDGWKEAARLRLAIEDKDKKIKEKPDLVIGKQKYKADLIAPALIVARFYGAQQQAIEELEAQVENLGQELEEMREENSGEDGLLEEVRDDKGNISKKSVQARMKEVCHDAEAQDERRALQAYLELLDRETEAKAKLKTATADLDKTVAARYGTLSEDEVKTLVVEDKWLRALADAIEGEMDRVSQALAGRVGQLAQRYQTPLPALTEEVECLSQRVDEHLEKMGFHYE